LPSPVSSADTFSAFEKFDDDPRFKPIEATLGFVPIRQRGVIETPRTSRWSRDETKRERAPPISTVLELAAELPETPIRAAGRDAGD
jgi:hypothetical protein